MTIVLTCASLFAAAIPMLFFLYLLWNLDLYTRKPLWLIGGAFLWGALGAVLFAIVGQILLDPFISESFPSNSDFISVTFIAPLTEEPAKALLLLALVRSLKYGNICDGFIFGAASGLGFGMTENAKYFIEGAMRMGAYDGGAEEWVSLVIVRTLFSAVMHALATSLVGASLGFGKFLPRIWRAIALGIGGSLAFGVHALWNGILVTGVAPGEEFLRLAEIFALAPSDSPLYYSAFFFLLELCLVGVIFFLCTLWERYRLKNALAYEAEQGRIPQNHVEILASFYKRRKEGWLQEEIPKREYIKCATQLALRGAQLRSLRDRRREWYELDYQRLQEEIVDLQSLQN